MSEVTKMEPVVPDAIQVESFERVPTACLDEKNDKGEVIAGPKFRGKLKLKQISMLERFEKMPAIDELANAGKRVAAALEAIKCTMGLWLEVDITHIKSGKRFTSLKDLMMDPRCDGIIAETANGLLRGFDEDDSGN
jgi:hypothetical protein